MSDSNTRKCEACGETWPVGFLGTLSRTFDLSGCPACNKSEWVATVPGGKDTNARRTRRQRVEPAAHH